MTAHVPAYGPPGEAILAALVDHLYPACPLLVRMCRGRQPQRLAGVLAVLDGVPEPIRLADGLVDPLGSDLCGWCQRVWRARYREEATSHA